MQRVREVALLLDHLRTLEGYIPSQELGRVIDALPANHWSRALRLWLEPHHGRRLLPSAWTYDLLSWARLERSARTLYEGVHLGTMHSAKGLEFDHVLLLDEGRMADTEEERRLLYVALTRARRSLQIFSSHRPSPVFAALRHPLLERRPLPMLAAEAPQAAAYDLLGRADFWIDWLGRQPETHPGHRAMEEAQVEDLFSLRGQGEDLSIVDSAGREVTKLSRRGRAVWPPRQDHRLKLKLVAVTREHAATREEPFRKLLRVESWWTGVWEGRWFPR